MRRRGPGASTAHWIRTEGHRAIQRNTDHTSEMMSSLLRERTGDKRDALALVFRTQAADQDVIKALAIGAEREGAPL